MGFDTEYGLLRGRRGRLVGRKTYSKNDMKPISHSTKTKHELSHQFSPFSKRKLISNDHSSRSIRRDRIAWEEFRGSLLWISTLALVQAFWTLLQLWIIWVLRLAIRVNVGFFAFGVHCGSGCQRAWTSNVPLLQWFGGVHRMAFDLSGLSRLFNSDQISEKEWGN